MLILHQASWQAAFMNNLIAHILQNFIRVFVLFLRNINTILQKILVHTDIIIGFGMDMIRDILP